MIQFQQVYLKKKYPLRISRGLHTGSINLFVSYSNKGVTGWGEMAPGNTEGAADAQAGEESLRPLLNLDFDKMSIYEVYAKGRAMNVAPCALAALDMALWDQKAKALGVPLYQLLGLPLPVVPTSLTIGINPPEVIKERIPLLLTGTGIKGLKIKLGSPEGIAADQAMFNQVIESTKVFPHVKIRVDANGGWSVPDAEIMMRWLAERGTEYIEQPIKEGEEDALPFLYKNRPLPIFIDESCRFSTQIPDYAHCIDGVNLKLMKCGGITEALRIVAIAKAFKLKTMIGCMGESNIGISAGAAISGVIDYIDLDSNLNLDPDAAEGSSLQNGIVIPRNSPGHGAYLKEK
jgi:L-Ala-D/L-Glu epimerase